MDIEDLDILICTHAYPPDTGGIAAFARDIHTLLENAGSNVEVFEGRTKEYIVSRLRNYLDIANIFVRMLYAIYKMRPDVVLCSRLLPLAPLALVTSLFFDFRLIIQVHGTELRDRYKDGWRKWILEKLYNRADQLWANSGFTAQLLRDYGCRAGRIEIIYPFITRDARELASRVNGKTKDDRFVLMTAAALYPRKGIDLVLKSLSELEDVNWEYRIAGQPYDSRFGGMYERMAKELGIADRVKFLGQLERRVLWEEMAHADIFVMPSRGYEDDIESFGIVFIEAQQFGIPCIGTDIGGIKEAIGEGGILIGDEDVEQLTESIRYLAEHPEERNRYSDRSLDRIKQDFTEESRQNDIQRAIKKLQHTEG